MKQYIIIFIATIFILLSCNAERSNPLDPQNPNNTLFKIEGNVQTVSFPRKKINDVNVYWNTGSSFVTTSNDGSFFIELTKNKNGWLVFSKEGYSIDSVYINWGNEKRKNLSVFLNALPQLFSNTFSSIVIQKYPNRKDYYIETIVKLKDNENDIDSLFFENKDLKIFEYLNYNVVKSLWERIIPLKNLNLRTLDELIGKTVLYSAKDKDGKIFELSETSLKRIIREEILIISPGNRQEVSLPLTLKWGKYQPGFNLKFKVEIFRDSDPDELVFQKEEISQDKLFINVNDELTSGNYYWVIYCIDEFGNQGSSKSASFKIK